MSILQNLDKDTWALKALQCLCAARPDLAEVVRSRASNEYGLLKAALLYSSNPKDSTPIFNALSELPDMNDGQRRKEPLLLLDQIELNWGGHESLMVRLLKLRDVKLALALVDVDGIDTLAELEIGPIEWWLDWLMDEKEPNLWWWLCNRISRLFEMHLTLEVRDAFVAEFNKSGSEYRRVLANSILLARDDLSTDSFSEDAISFLIASLRKRGTVDAIRGHLLGNTATEPFVTDRLLPLLRTAEEPLATNLRRVLRNAGSRHGRRYVAT